MHLEKVDATNRMTTPILLPTGRDAELVDSLLNQVQIDAVVCASMDEMLNQVRIGCGPFVVGDEAFSEDALYRLLKALDTQPEWSDLPGIIFIGRYSGHKYFYLLEKRREISLIQRPIKKSLFMNMIQTAVDARLRQYQVKDLLEDLVHTNKKLSSHTALLQKLAMQLTRVEDRERQRIAQILHDDLQQMLAAAKLQIEMLFDYEDFPELKPRTESHFYSWKKLERSS
jgi:signal transduction histidine kinase